MTDTPETTGRAGTDDDRGPDDRPVASVVAEIVLTDSEVLRRLA